MSVQLIKNKYATILDNFERYFLKTESHHHLLSFDNTVDTERIEKQNIEMTTASCINGKSANQY